MKEFKTPLYGKIGYSILRGILGPLVRGTWIKNVEGLENFPKTGAVILAANHQSYFDFLGSIAVSPRKIHYMAAEKFFHSWFWKPLMYITGQIRVDRNAKDKKEMFQYVYSALLQGRVFGIYPEGTRNRENNGQMQKAFTGVARFALTAKVPVLPLGIVNAFEVMSPHDKFPKFKKIIEFKFGKPMTFVEYYDREQTDEVLCEVTDKIMLEIARLSGKEYPFVEKK